MIVTTKELFEHAYGKYAVGAYNINNLEQAMGLFRGNLGKIESAEAEVDDAVAAPFIIQISRGARSYTDKRMLEAVIRGADEVFPEAVFAVHLDHGTEEACYDCIDSGFYSSVMIDASHEDFEENIAITKRVVERAHAKGIVVEAELGMLGGVEEDIDVSEEHASLTDPDQAAEFVERTGCDSLAVAIGTSHGAYKFTRKPTGDILAIGRIKEIHARIPNTHLVMHGSSSVPQEWLEVIRKHGGQMKETYGVPVEEIVTGIKHGVRKINIDTDIRLAITGAIRKVFAETPEKFDPRDYMKPAREAMAQVVKERMIAFGQAGWADKVPNIGLDEMARRYRS